tara:strand:- start:6349 stop:7395 length:1047 start_codon:yes stop_codon:yes gene_type:complete
MKFFNPKEEVLDIKMTQYGRHLLSKGLWKPEFYAFFDDNVLYDSQYGDITATGSINVIESRIQDETPLLKAQHTFTGCDEYLFDGQNDLVDRVRLSTYEKLNVMPMSLGTSDYESTKTPAFRAQFLAGEIKGLEFNLTGSSRTVSGVASTAHQLQKIPQLEFDIEYKIKVIDPEFPADEAVQFEVDPSLTPGTTYSDGKQIVVGPEQIIFTLEELNAPFDFENYDIEVFEITNEFGASGEQILNPLNFIKPLQMVENNILIDKKEAEIKAGRVSGAAPEIDPTFVRYFFDINVDDEISETILCKSISKIKAAGKSLYTDIDINCPDLSIPVRQNIYGSDALDEDCSDY